MHAAGIVAAAGSGSRLGSELPKALVLLRGRPLVAWSVECLRAGGVAEVVVPVPPGRAAEFAAVLDGDVRLVEGGATRTASVRAALAAVHEYAGVVLVHDAARPLVETALIEAVARAAWESGAAIPVLELPDTIKKMRDGRVRETLDRSELAAAQTPQGFRFALLVRAYEAAFRDQVTLTDEAMAVERVGEAVVAVPGSARNRKITTPEDLAWAEVELARSGIAP